MATKIVQVVTAEKRQVNRIVVALDTLQTQKFLLEIALDILHDDAQIREIKEETVRPVALLLATWIKEINPTVGVRIFDFYQMILAAVSAETSRLGTEKVEALIRAGLVAQRVPAENTPAKIVIDSCDKKISQCVDRKRFHLTTYSNYFDVGGFSQMSCGGRKPTKASTTNVPAEVVVSDYVIDYSQANSRRSPTAKSPLMSGSVHSCKPESAGGISAKDFYILGEFSGATGPVSVIIAYRGTILGRNREGEPSVTFQFKVSNTQESNTSRTDKVMYGWSRSAAEMSRAMSAWRKFLENFRGEWSASTLENIFATISSKKISCLCVDIMSKFWGDFGFVCEILGTRRNENSCAAAVVTADKHLAVFCNTFGVCFLWSGSEKVLDIGEYLPAGRVTTIEDVSPGGPFTEKISSYYGREERSRIIKSAWK